VRIGSKVHIVGGGLAGSEAAWQLLSAGIPVVLHEMRPVKMTEAHKTGGLAELVCSNSFKAQGSDSASGCLKEEMLALDSLIINSGLKASVPAGKALAVDRILLSEYVSEKLSQFAHFTKIEEEVTSIPTLQQLEKTDEYWLIASGPLTHGDLYQQLLALCGEMKNLYFYDAIAPVIAADTINRDFCFKADRYQKDGEKEGDYLNLPLSKEQYEEFIDDILKAEMSPLHNFEKANYFEACLPIEVMAERGKETLRFGPLKPVGLVDPSTGKEAHACIQLRCENKDETMYSMVGFQTKMKWGEQKRIFSKIPALAEAEFLRFGSIHRNTYVESPKVLNKDFSFKSNSRVFLAGQLTGVEGYVESAAIGLLAARVIAARCLHKDYSLPPPTTMMGALAHYVLAGSAGEFSPMNINLGLLPPYVAPKRMGRADRRLKQCERSQEDFQAWKQSVVVN